jgi:hypothetical protein
MRTRSSRCSPRIDWTSSSGKKALLAPLSLTILVGVGAAQGTSREFRWNELQKQGSLLAGPVLSPEPGAPFHRLKVEGSTFGPTRVTVLTIDRPHIVGPRYGLRGQIRYEGIEGIGYLEMWNYFPDGGQYFSRTLADEGPMMKLSGASNWRPFLLPFDATGARPPTRLVFNVVLPGRGVVYLGPVELTELNQAGGGAGEIAAHRVTDAAGAIAGAVLGCVGAMIGVLTALGRARSLVIASARTLIAFGAAAFVAGIIASAWSQPYSVFYPLLLLGAIACIVPLGLLPTIRRRYEEVELRTMRAHDIR